MGDLWCLQAYESLKQESFYSVTTGWEFKSLQLLPNVTGNTLGQDVTELRSRVHMYTTIIITLESGMFIERR